MTEDSSRAAARALIRELIASGRAPSPDEVASIRDLMATAPFDPKVYSVPTKLRGIEHLGRPFGAREPSLAYHLMKRVIVDEQWTEGTTEADYLADLRAAILAATSRLAVYARRGGLVGVTVTPTRDVVPDERLGPKREPLMLVVYSADQDVIASAYHFSSFATISIPEEARWLD